MGISSECRARGTPNSIAPGGGPQSTFKGNGRAVRKLNMPQRLSLSGFWPLLSTVPTNALINAADGARLCRSDCVGWVRSHGSVHQAGGGRCCASRSRILPRRRTDRNQGQAANREDQSTAGESTAPFAWRDGPRDPHGCAQHEDSKFAAQTFRHAPRLDPIGRPARSLRSDSTPTANFGESPYNARI